MKQHRALHPRMAGLASIVRVAIGIVLLAGLLSRALVPAGFMPAVRSEDGAIVVAMCSGMGAVQALPAPAPARPHHLPGDDGRCPFALAPAFAVLADAQLITPPVRTEWVNTEPVSVEVFPESRARRAHAPPTGPPVLA